VTHDDEGRASAEMEGIGVADDRDGASALSARRARPNIDDIAARTGLHKSTVSRAVSGKGRVSPATRARVLAALDEAGFVPSRLAASLRTGRTGLLGLVIDGPYDPIRLATMQGALDAATHAGYGMVVYMTAHDQATTAAPTAGASALSPAGAALDGAVEPLSPGADTIAQGWVDGTLVLWPSRADEPLVRRIHDLGLPLVLIEPQAAMDGVPAVYADAYHDGYLSARYLLDLGHRRIAACGHPAEWGVEGAYLDGYRAALAEDGVPHDPALDLAGGWSYEAGYETATRWLGLSAPPTAVCFRSDMAALGAMAAARDLGRRVPEDLAVIGGDDTQMACWIKPTLTVPRERRSGLARTATDLLLALIAGQAAPTDPVLVRTDLVVRQSTVLAP